MLKFLKSALPAALALLLLGGCFDPSPGEIGLHTTVQGTARACNVLVFTSKGKQIQMELADQYGVAYIKGLAPDTYTLKFSGADDHMFAAVRHLKVTPGSSIHLEVDLEKADDVAGETAASSGGGGGGNATDSND